MITDDLLEKVSNITRTDYSDVNDLKEQAESIIEDLLYEIEYLDEKIENILQDREDNFRRLSISEQL